MKNRGQQINVTGQYNKSRGVTCRLLYRGHLVSQRALASVGIEPLRGDCSTKGRKWQLPYLMFSWIAAITVLNVFMDSSVAYLYPGSESFCQTQIRIHAFFLGSRSQTWPFRKYIGTVLYRYVSGSESKWEMLSEFWIVILMDRGFHWAALFFFLTHFRSM